MFSRREFLSVSAVSAAAVALSGCKCPFGCGRKPQIGAQLYSVRDLCGKDFVGTLKELKKEGYVGVEFAGYYGKSAKELRAILDDCGLVACGTHIGLDSIMPAHINETMDFAQEVGNNYLMIPGMGPGNDWKGSLGEWWKKTAGDFGVAAETAAARGMYVGYHNHQHEFKTKCADMGNKCLYEIFFDNTSPKVSMQMDIGHVVAAGEDPIFWLKKYPNPCKTVHAKEVYTGGASGILGEPVKGVTGVDWKAVFPVVESKKLDWYIVEAESNPGAFTAMDGSIKFLKANGR
jgi:sugar phosphate isomerase/epimerase